MVRKTHHSPRVAAFRGNPFVRQQVLKAASRLELTSLLKGIKIPVLWMAGVNAPLSATDVSSMVRLSKKQKNVRLKRLKDLAHYPHLEAPALMAQTIQSFLSK
jgi:pimeloyl-ACP methyl ester carboxylesterase